MRRQLFYCDHHEIHLPAEHKFPMAKYRLLRQMLEQDGSYSMTPAPAALPEMIERVHDPAYVAAFLRGTLSPQAIRRIGFPWSESLVRRTLCSVGGTLSRGRRRDGVWLRRGACRRHASRVSWRRFRILRLQ